MNLVEGVGGFYSSSSEINKANPFNLIAAIIPEFFSFKGLGPELNNLINFSNKEILLETDQQKKNELVKERKKLSII